MTTWVARFATQPHHAGAATALAKSPRQGRAALTNVLTLLLTYLESHV